MRDPIEPLFPQSLLDALRQSPGSPAFEQGDRSVSRGELLDLIGRLAGAMRRAGLGPGRGIAVHLAVSLEAFAAHIAANGAGRCCRGPAAVRRGSARARARDGRRLRARRRDDGGDVDGSAADRAGTGSAAVAGGVPERDRSAGAAR